MAGREESQHAPEIPSFLFRTACTFSGRRKPANCICQQTREQNAKLPARATLTYYAAVSHISLSVTVTASGHTGSNNHQSTGPVDVFPLLRGIPSRFIGEGGHLPSARPRPSSQTQMKEQRTHLIKMLPSKILRPQLWNERTQRVLTLRKINRHQSVACWGYKKIIVFHFQKNQQS